MHDWRGGKRIGLWATFIHIQSKLGHDNTDDGKLLLGHGGSPQNLNGSPSLSSVMKKKTLSSQYEMVGWRRNSHWVHCVGLFFRHIAVLECVVVNYEKFTQC